MRLTLVNQTDSPILYHPIPTKTSPPCPDQPQLQIALHPSSSTTTDLPRLCSKLTLSQREHLKHDSTSELGDTRLMEDGPKSEFNIRVHSFGKSRAWGVVTLNDGEDCPCPWRIYWMKVRILPSNYLL